MNPRQSPRGSAEIRRARNCAVLRSRGMSENHCRIEKVSDNAGGRVFRQGASALIWHLAATANMDRRPPCDFRWASIPVYGCLGSLGDDRP